MTRCKICGLMREEDIALCVTAGADAVGFVVDYPLPVPWNLERRQAAVLMRLVPPFVTRVIVVGDEPETVLALTDFLHPHVVQLHGSEPLELTAQLTAAIQKRGVQVIKALRFATETGECHPGGGDPIAAARTLAAIGVDALLLDSVSAGRPAGTGRSIDWGRARSIRAAVSIPVILAGGLHAGNVGAAIVAVAPFAVDVISGVEEPVGRKDPAKVRAFVAAVRTAPG